MPDPARCVTHYMDACECQRERLRRLEAVATAAAGVLRDGCDPAAEAWLAYQGNPGNIEWAARWKALRDALDSLKKEAKP